ncbi:patellin-3-like [Silene latifolia]|uniref:patellin-3-like n=1 Tax=Silene latifolia TaxID=37657 RepID=UPI003D775D37
MAEETQKPETVPQAEVVVPEAEKEVSTPPAAAAVVVEGEAEKAVDAEVADAEKIVEQPSFKEETNVVSELPEFQRKAIEELKKLIQDACAKHEFSSPPTPSSPSPAAKEEEKTEEVVVEEEKEQTPATEVAPSPTHVVAAEPPAATTEEEQTPPPVVETKAEEVAPAPAATEIPVAAEAGKEEEKTVETIKETIVEEITPPTVEETTPPTVEVVTPPVEPEEVSIWGIPLLADERTDVILLKFLRARDFKVKEAFTMIRNTVRWRKEFDVDNLLDEDLGNEEYSKVLFTHGFDKEGRIVCYNVFGEFQNKELYQNTFADAEKRKKFLKWLIQFLEKIIRDLDFNPKGINSIVLVNDLKNSPGYGKRDVSKIIDKFLVILQDNYPEFVARQLCINTSWWYVAYYWIYLTVFTPRSKSKFVFASPSKTPETLFKYIAPEHVPVQYGGHSKIGENEFSSADPVTEVIIKPGTKHPIEFAFSEATELVWELRVIGWDVNYGAEFLPEKEGGYTLNISKPKKITLSIDEPVISDSFKVTEAGKVVITIDNQSSKKKKLLYRSKVKVSE